MQRRLTLALILAGIVGLTGIGPVWGGDETKLEIPYEKYTLDNGLEVILHEDHTLPLVAVSVWYHVAAYHEVVGKSGFAHLFEHMMFQGSGHIADDVHIRTLENIGASTINGTTSFDRTNYFETVPSNHLETALWLESDRMGFLLDALSQKKLDNQRDVVKNERRQGIETRPYGLAEEKLWQAVFPKPHPYHGRVIGSMADLSAASLEDVRQFFTTWYAPSNATLTIAGDFTPDQAKALVQKYFGSLAKTAKPVPPKVADVTIAKPILIEHAEAIGKLPKLQVVWLTPKIYAAGDAAADVLSNLLSNGKSSRLHKKLIHELELAQSVSAYQYSLGAQSVFFVDVVGRTGVAPKRLLTEVDAVLEEIRQGKVKQQDVERAVNRFETSFFKGLQRLGGFGGKAEKLQGYNHFLGDPGFMARDLDRYRKVSIEEVVAFAKNELDTAKRAVLFAVPAAADEQPKKEVTR